MATRSRQTAPNLDLLTTTHGIYSLYHQPVAPMAEPWAKVLELSSGMLFDALGPNGTPNQTTVVSTLAEELMRSGWLDVNTRFMRTQAVYRYDPGRSCTCGIVGQPFNSAQVFGLPALLEEMEQPTSLLIQCNDNANLLAVLTASQGLAATPRFFTGASVGWLPTTAVVFPAGRYACLSYDFSFHQVPLFNSAVYDTSVFIASTTPQCHVGGRLHGLTWPAYLATAFPGVVLVKFCKLGEA